MDINSSALLFLSCCSTLSFFFSMACLLFYFYHLIVFLVCWYLAREVWKIWLKIVKTLATTVELIVKCPSWASLLLVLWSGTPACCDLETGFGWKCADTDETRNYIHNISPIELACTHVGVPCNMIKAASWQPIITVSFIPWYFYSWENFHFLSWN